MKIETLNAENFPALRRFVEEVWDRPKTDNYYRWRYWEAPQLTTLLAMQDEKCIASLSAFDRKFHNGNRVIDAFEAFDWYTLPAMKRSGVGIRLLKHLLARGKPLVVLGGSEDTLHYLPRMGFKNVTPATEFVLPLTGAYILRNRNMPAFVKRLAVPMLNRMASAWFSPTGRLPGNNIEIHPVARVDAHVAEVDGPDGFRSVPDPLFLDWLFRGSGTGAYIPLVFRRDGEVVAWSLARLYRSGGLLHGAILDTRLKSPDAALAKTVLQLQARILGAYGVDDVRAFATSDVLCGAFKDAGFRAGRERIPAMIWCGEHQLSLQQVSLTTAPDGMFWPLQEDAVFPASASHALQLESVSA